MAVIWRKETPQASYEVRRAGRSIRLYSNGVLHSQYNPSRVLGGQVWDMLLLPALLLKEPTPKVLVLGVGGGAVIKQLLAVSTPERIVGVDIDRNHLAIATRFFGVPRNPSIQLICDDAISWLQQYRGPKFDYIVDDLFSHNDGEPNRVIEVNKEWGTLLAKHLTPNGGLVVNYESNQSATQSYFAQNHCRFKSAWRLSIKGFDNRVVCYFKHVTDRPEFNKVVESLSNRFGKAGVTNFNTRIRREF
ncbi:spermidine synthase [Aurantivibrio plasticivorans]